MRKREVRDAHSYYEWDHFWTPAFQEGYRRDMVTAMYDFSIAVTVTGDEERQE